MALLSPNHQPKCIDDFLTILASHGVHFLLSPSPKSKVPLSSSFGAPGKKKFCLFFSANWCRPCKTFTPQLVQVYDTLRARGEELEIIFVSFDQDENGFNQHFNSMPWLAVPFHLVLNRQLINTYQVHRIPSLIPLPQPHQHVDEEDDFNLIGLIEDYGAQAFPFTSKRRQELKAIDDSKRQGGKLEQLLPLNYLLSRDHTKIIASQLTSKTVVALYFAAHWCPPCRAFTTQLMDVYKELTGECFEIVLVSTDRDHKEFDVNISSMPWLAIPYEDRRTRQDLCRIFDIKGIPALVLIGNGEDGKTLINTNGKEMITLYGAKAFPYTESRIAEIEASLRKEGESLPGQVKDAKHEHQLKLDMAKAYVCDACKNEGRFWAFSCDVCNYDLHPTCVDVQEAGLNGEVELILD